MSIIRRNPGVIPTFTLANGVIAESVDRRNNFSTSVTITNGTQRMTAIQINENKTITSITFAAGGIAPVGITHLWAALYDKNLSLLRQSPDETSPTWTEGTDHVFTLTSPFKTTYAGLYYISVCETASTRNNLLGISIASTVISARIPTLSGTSDSGLVATAPSVAGAISASSGMPYCFVS